MLWRTGRRKPRHLYLQLRDEPHDTDPEVAVTLGTDEEAEHTARQIVDAMNTRRHGDRPARFADVVGEDEARQFSEQERAAAARAAKRRRGWDHPE